MTSPIAAEIRALPAALQLAAALAVIEDLTGQDNPGIRWLVDHYGLSFGQARVLWALHRAAPRILSRDQLARSVWGHGDVGEDRSIDSYIKRIRARAGVAIRTSYGAGYSLARPLPIPTLTMGEVITAPRTATALRALHGRVDAALAQLQTIAADIDNLAGKPNG